MVLLISVIIASFIEAGARALKRIHIPRPVAVFFLYMLGFVVIGGILYLIVPLFVHEIADFIDLFPKNSLLVKLVGPLADNGFNSGTFKQILASQNLSGASSFLGILQGIFGGLINAMLVVIISFYLSIQEKGIEQFLRVVVPDQYEDYIVDLWNRVEKKIGYWFGGQVLVAILIGLITYLGLFFMGVPYALILAAVAALFVFVPFGTALSVAPAIVLAYWEVE
jgi:predicted PurR-regulated permease PerM